MTNSFRKRFAEWVDLQCDRMLTEAERAADERYAAIRGQHRSHIFRRQGGFATSQSCAYLDMNNISSFGTLFANV